MNDYTYIFSVIVAMFFLSGCQKLMSVETTVSGLKKRMVLFNTDYFTDNIYTLIIVAAALWQILASVSIVYSSMHMYKYKHVGMLSAISLIVFTILATLIFHFPPTGMHYYAFISNVTTCGSLALIAYVFYSLSTLTSVSAI